jgi:hypothetical protein
MLKAKVTEVSWDNWQSTLGNTETRNTTVVPVPNQSVQFSVDYENGGAQPGILSAPSFTTNASGYATVKFTMGQEGATVYASIPGQNADEWINGSVWVGFIPEEWTLSHNEATINIDLAAAGGTNDVPENAIRQVTGHVTYESWQIWTSNWGGYGRYSDAGGAAIGAEATFSKAGGDGNISNASGLTDSNGNATATFTMGDQNSRLLLSVSYAGTSAVASLDFQAEPWLKTGDGSEVVVTMGSNTQEVSAYATYNTWENWKKGTRTKRLNQTSAPAIGAPVLFSIISGSGGVGTPETTTDGNGRSATSYTVDQSSIIQADVSFNGVVGYASIGVSPGDGGGGGGGGTENQTEDSTEDTTEDQTVYSEFQTEDSTEMPTEGQTEDSTDDSTDDGTDDSTEDATEDSGPAGPKVEAEQTLKIVGTSGSASLTATGFDTGDGSGGSGGSGGGYTPGGGTPGGSSEPTWTTSGGNLNVNDGDLTGSWDGSSTSTITASGADGEASVDIEIVPENKMGITISKEEIESKLETHFSDYFSATEDYFNMSGELEASRKSVDFYNNGEKVGSCYTISPGLQLGCSVSLDVEVPIVTVPGLRLTGSIGVEAEVGFQNNFSYDESKANPVQANMELHGSAQVFASLGACYGLPSNWAKLSVNGEVNCGGEMSGPVTANGGQVGMNYTFTTHEGELVGTIKCVIMGTTIKLYESEPKKIGRSTTSSGSLVFFDLSN